MGNKTILIVEDEKPLEQAIKMKFEREGLSVVTARSFAQAIDYLHTIEPVDVIWLDHYLLGKETGLDFLAEVKNDEKWKHVPVFAVTNTVGPEKKDAYLQLGATEYLVKSNIVLGDVVKQIKESVGL